MAGAFAARIKRALHLQRTDVAPVREHGVSTARAETELEPRLPAGRCGLQPSNSIHKPPPARVMPKIRALRFATGRSAWPRR